MNISNLTEQQITDFYKNDEILYKLALPDFEIEKLESGQLLTMAPGEISLGIQHENEMISILRCNYFTPISYIVHCCIASKWHKKGLSKIVRDVYLQYLADTTDLQKVVSAAPSCCQHAINALEYSEFEKEGTFKNIMPWRNKIVDLIWYSYDLNKYRGNK